MTGSHEGAGTIVKLGPNIPNGTFKHGNRVGLHCFYHLCGIVRGDAELMYVGSCESCKMGGNSIMMCKNKGGALGLSDGLDGSFAEYVIADSFFTVPIPDNVSFADTVSHGYIYG